MGQELPLRTGKMPLRRTPTLAIWSAITLAAGVMSLVVPTAGNAAVSGQVRVDQVGSCRGKPSRRT
jgi:hypothetical protein